MCDLFFRAEKSDAGAAPQPQQTVSERLHTEKLFSTMECVTLLQSFKRISFDVTKRIICQKARDDNVVSTSNGCKRIREVSDIHNERYKKYTMRSVLDKITETNRAQSQDSPFSERNKTDERSTRSEAVHHPPHTFTRATALRDVTCIICGSKLRKQVYNK